jgi:hypothetical protein
MSIQYYVWKRSDGHVSACTYMPQGWNDNKNDKPITFESLKTFDNWDNEVFNFITPHQTINES